MTIQLMSEDISKIALSLSKFQGSVENVLKSSTVKTGSYQYSYADLASIRDAIADPLRENELAIVQSFFEEEGRTYLQTTLVHSSGQWMKSILKLGKFERTQQLGSEITYMRRYALSSILGIVTEEDDDGKAAHDAPRIPASPSDRLTAQQGAEITALLKDLLSQSEQKEYLAFTANLKTLLKIKNVDDMKASQFEQAKKLISRQISDKMREKEEEEDEQRMA